LIFKAGSKMVTRRLKTPKGPFSLQYLSELTGAQLSDKADPHFMVHHIAPLDEANVQDITYLHSSKKTPAFEITKAGACIIPPEVAHRAPSGMHLLISSDPERTYALIAQAFYPRNPLQSYQHPSAVVDSSAKIAENVYISAGVVIGADVVIGSGTFLAPNCVLEENVILGARCTIGANSNLAFCQLGDDVLIQPGVCIGQEGFGFAMGAQGHVRIPHIGNVVIGNDVEIGANTTIDRGTWHDTIVCDGARIDNLVQIGHNVKLGRGVVLAGQVGVSGSTELADFAAAGGQVGIADHVKVGVGAQMAAQSGIMRDVPDGVTVMGSPAKPIKEYFREKAELSKLTKKKN
jgi:UDP-3-O-[3-hydroxymyristoyl] glucosamine N-acyltransferase